MTAPNLFFLARRNFFLVCFFQRLYYGTPHSAAEKTTTSGKHPRIAEIEETHGHIGPGIRHRS